MKQILFALAFFVALSATAQDSTQVTYQPVNVDTISKEITLPMWLHYYVIGFMNNRGDVDKSLYVRQVVAANLGDSAELKVKTNVGMVKRLYSEMGSLPVGIATDYNDSLKKRLFPQVMDMPALLLPLTEIVKGYKRTAAAIVGQGKEYVRRLKEQ